jgi:hypothetical protein
MVFDGYIMYDVHTYSYIDDTAVNNGEIMGGNVKLSTFICTNINE